ncbi:MAG TPA: hypothetical protein VNL37_03725 [Candidatus Polarisedimenticolia bacterium]|nr:hypothetical protein [Candidatus Polarisedimenticolia bacterium]
MTPAFVTPLVTPADLHRIDIPVGTIEAVGGEGVTAAGTARGGGEELPSGSRAAG